MIEAFLYGLQFGAVLLGASVLPGMAFFAVLVAAAAYGRKLKAEKERKLKEATTGLLTALADIAKGGASSKPDVVV